MLSSRTSPARTTGALIALYLASAVPFLLGRSLGSRQFQSWPSTMTWAMGIPLFFSALSHLLQWNGMKDLAALGMVRKAWGRHLAVGAAIGLCAVLAVFSLETAARHYTITGVAPVIPGLMWLLAAMADSCWTAVSEELLFRGYINRALAAWEHPAWTYLISAVLFAAAHVGSQGASPLRMIELGLSAVVYMALLRGTGSLWPAIGMHWAWNTFNVWMVEKNHILIKTVAAGAFWGRYSLTAVLAVILLVTVAFRVRGRRSWPALPSKG